MHLRIAELDQDPEPDNISTFYDPDNDLCYATATDERYFFYLQYRLRRKTTGIELLDIRRLPPGPLKYPPRDFVNDDTEGDADDG